MSPAAHPLPRAGASADATALFEFLDKTHQRMQTELQHMNCAVDALVQEQLQPAERAQLQEAVRWFDTTARQHHLDEEKHVLPLLQASDNAQVADIARRLRQDHGWIEQNWLEIEPMLSAVVNGNHWFEPGQLQESVQLFTQLCLDHLALEESQAYPDARKRIDPTALAAAEREMAARRKTQETRQRARH